MEVSEEKANQRVEEFKREMKTLTVRLKEAENRAESAEKQVKRLQKEVDRLEGMCGHFTVFNLSVCGESVDSRCSIVRLRLHATLGCINSYDIAVNRTMSIAYTAIY